MRITLINGSPKKDNSASEVILNKVKRMLPADADLQEVKLNGPVIAEADFELMAAAQVLIFTFPLYVDGIPSHLLHCLTQLEGRLNPAGTNAIRVFRPDQLRLL